MDSLAANPSGSSIFGQPGNQSPDPNSALYLVNQVKDREMNDFKEKSRFMSAMSLQQDRLRSIFNPEQQQQPNVVMGQDPNQMTGYQKGELGIRQQEIGQESQRLAQQGKLGQEALDIKGQQEKLNQQKSDQIHEQKQADMQRKIDESNQTIQLAQQRLQQTGDNQAAQLQAHKDLAAAMEERHKLELAQKDAQFQKTSDQHQQTINALNERLKQSSRSKQVKRDAQGNEITTTTERGSAADTVQVTGPDGTVGTIPADKLDDWNANHAPQGEQ